MYLGVKEAGIALGVSRQWIHTLVRRKSLNTATIGGRRLILNDTVFRALARKRKKK